MRSADLDQWTNDMLVTFKQLNATVRDYEATLTEGIKPTEASSNEVS